MKDLQDGGVKAGKIVNAILFMIAKDDMPISTVEKEGFKHLMKTIAPLYKLPCRTTISNMVDSKYKALSTVVKKKLENAGSVAMTTDIWTDTLNTQSYLGVTCHFLDKEKKEIASIILSVEELDERHDSEYINSTFLTVCTQWDMPIRKVTCITTDNAHNMAKAVSLLVGEKKHLGCFAHTINLIANSPFNVKTGLSVIQNLVSSVKDIVTYFKQSVNAADALRKAQETPLKLIQSVPTRWNSTYYQLERFLKLSSIVAPILLKNPKSPLMLSASQIEIIEDIVHIFKPLQQITIELSGEKFATSSIVIPLINCLKKSLENVQAKTETGKQCKAMILKELDLKFQNIEKNSILAISTLLDPRFKKLHFNNQIVCSQQIQEIYQKVREVSNSRDSNSIQNSTETDDKSLWSFHKRLMMDSTVNRASDIEDHNHNDFTNYLREPVCDIKSDPIQYWLKSKHSLKLRTIALEHLTVMATSVPCERVFSLAGNILTDKRNRFQKLDKILFLKSLEISEWNI